MINYPNRITDHETVLKLRELIDAANNSAQIVASNASALANMQPPLTLAQIQSAIQSGGTNPINVTGLQGALSSPQPTLFGLFAALPNYGSVAKGTIYYATDQSTAYIASASGWDTIAKRILFGGFYAIFAATLTSNRTYTLPNGTDTIVLLNFIQTLTNKQIGDPTDPTKTLAFLLSGATSGSTTTFIFSQSVNRNVTFPDAAGNVPVLPTAATTQTGTGAIVRQATPTITTPVIGDFTNAQHTHQNAAGGGTLDGAAIATGTTGSGNLLRASVLTGFDTIVATGSATGQTGAVTSICTYTPSNAVHFFEVAGYIDVTAFTAGTISLQCSYTDPSGNAQTVTIPLASLAGVFSATVGSLTDAQSATLGIVTSGANAITLSTSVSLLSATYNVYAWIKLIQ